MNAAAAARDSSSTPSAPAPLHADQREQAPLAAEAPVASDGTDRAGSACRTGGTDGHGSARRTGATGGHRRSTRRIGAHGWPSKRRASHRRNGGHRRSARRTGAAIGFGSAGRTCGQRRRGARKRRNDAARAAGRLGSRACRDAVFGAARRRTGAGGTASTACASATGDRSRGTAADRRNAQARQRLSRALHAPRGQTPRSVRFLRLHARSCRCRRMYTEQRVRRALRQLEHRLEASAPPKYGSGTSRSPSSGAKSSNSPRYPG